MNDSLVNVEQPAMKQAAFDVHDLLDKVMGVMAVTAHRNGLELVCHMSADVPGKVPGDPHDLRKVVFHLVEQAVKSAETGEVVLRITQDHAEEEACVLRFSVSQTGTGISADKVESSRGHSDAAAGIIEKSGGATPAFTRARPLVERMGGRIWIDRSDGYGAAVSFTARLGTGPGSARHAAPSCLRLNPLSVLVVDDNSTSRRVLRMILEECGLLVSEAAGGEQGLAELQRARERGAPYALVLLDCRMPVVNGFQVAETIMRAPRLGAMTVMMLTTDNRSADMARCHELGIGRCLIKPIRRADLIELVNAISVEQSSAQEPAPALVTPASQDGAKVLLVEDFADNRMVIQAYLKKTPHRLDIAENGRVAVEKCQAERYDLVFMDVEMPVMDGHAATRTIRAWEKEKGVQPMPIIALTAHALKEQVQQSLDAGCTAHLSKPIRKAAVLDAIAAYASRPPAHRPPNGGQTEQKLIVRAEADLQAFIPEFLKSRHQDVLSITEALACGDFEHIRMVGHGIKGIGGCYGFDRISEVGHALEEAAQKKDAEEIRKHVEELAGYLQRIECVHASPPR